MTSASGAKIQPYFDIPSPGQENLIYFKVQGEEISPEKIAIWLSSTTARELKTFLGDLSEETLNAAIAEFSEIPGEAEIGAASTEDLAQQFIISKEAYLTLITRWGGISDEHRAQLFLQTVRG